MTGPAALAQAGMGIGALLRAHRARAGLSQEALAARAGLALAAVSALERGVRRRPYPHTVAALARALRLSAAERAALAAAARAPAAAPEAASRPAPANLPAPPTSLIGRDREAEALAALLGEADVRLVTLTGVGGCGKTRLALEVAHALAGSPGGARGSKAAGGAPCAGDGGARSGAATGGVGFPDGVWLVELAPLADPALVPQAVAAALGVPEAPGAALLDGLVAALRPRTLLLVLDNCEHLLDAAAALAARLLAACPGVRVLATSREPLQIAGERQHPVPPLAVPDAGAAVAVADLAGYPAVRLFVARAQAVAPGFALGPGNAAAVAEVCARLAGLPLALELAAARAGVLSAAQIAARLDDCLRLLTGGSRAGPTRQQTLRGALDWSHALLAEPERTEFRRLAVFAGGFDLEAAEAVCSEDVGSRMGAAPAPGPTPPPPSALRPPDVLDALTSLVHRSLVVAEPSGGPGGGPGGEAGGAARYRLLEPVRQYAAARLEASGEAAAVRSRHAAWAAALAEQAGPGLFTRNQLDALAWLDAEQDNLRAALGWCLRRAPETGLRLAGRLWPYWRLREHHTEGRRWLTDCVAAAPNRTAAWARAALGAGILARDLGEVAAGRAHLEACLACARALGERELAAWALRDLGQQRVRQGERESAEALLVEGLALARATGDQRGAGAALMILAEAAGLAGDADRARALQAESLAAARRVGDRWLLSSILLQVGGAAVDAADFRAALPLLEEGVAVTRELGMPSREGEYQWQLGRVALAQGDSARAVPLLEALRAAALARHSPRGVAEALADLGRAAHARGDPAAATALLTEALRLRQALVERLGIVECLEALAAVAAETVPARAARLLGAAAAARRVLGAPPPPIRRPDLAAAERAAGTALGPAAAATARAAGAALSLEQAAAEALRAPAPAARPAGRRPEIGDAPAAAPGARDGAAAGNATGCLPRSPIGLRPMPSRSDSAGALTPREREVAALLAAGCHTDRQLAARLTISPATAGTHVQRVLEKLGLHSRWQVADRWSERGLRAASPS